MGNKSLCCTTRELPANERPQMYHKNNIENYQFKGIQIELIQGDFKDFEGDAIVNALQDNPYTQYNSIILKQAGDSLQQSLMKLQNLEPTQVSITNGGKLKYKNIIHAALPKWEGNDGGQNELIELIMTYKNVMKKVNESKCTSVTFYEQMDDSEKNCPKIFHLNALTIAIAQYLDENELSNLKKISYISCHEIDIRNFKFEIQKRMEMELQKELKQIEKENYQNLEKVYSEKSQSSRAFAQTTTSSLTKQSYNFKN